jgi:hypothetical protein
VSPRGTGALRSAVRARRSISTATLRRRAWEDGILGGQPIWLLVGGFAWLLWGVAWAWRREPELVYRTKLKPGETLSIATLPPTERRRRG